MKILRTHTVKRKSTHATVSFYGYDEFNKEIYVLCVNGKDVVKSVHKEKLVHIMREIEALKELQNG